VTLTCAALSIADFRAMTNDLWGVQGKIAYDFDKIGMELTGSYRSVDFNQVNASSDGIDYPGRNLATEQYDNFSGNFWQTKSQSEVFELRVFAKKGQRFRWNLGGSTLTKTSR
jgi:iron complex outermembrane receptor protein